MPKWTKWGMRSIGAGAATVALLLVAGSDSPVRGAEDAVAFAKQVVEAGRQSKMSRSALTEGGAYWIGADSSPPPIKGASVAVVPCPLVLTVCKLLSDSAEEAAAAIGWDSFTIDTKGDPSLAQKGVDVAITRGVSCVLTLASPARDLRTQIARGKERGIAFVTGFADDAREYGGDVGYGLDYEAAGALLAANVIANGGGKVVAFDDPAFPQLTVRLKGFQDYLAENGGGEAEIIRIEEFSVGKGAPDLITKMQAILTRMPKGSFQWIIAPYDEALRPLLETAEQRERTEIRGVSFDGEEVAFESIRNNGLQSATINWGLEWVAWAGIDECNRALNGAPVGVNKDFPIQLVDETNVPPPGQGYDAGFDFKAKYISLWDAARN